MKKQKTLAFLVKHLDNWPTKIMRGPLISGYRWVKDDDGKLFLFDDHGVDCETVEEFKISESEWLSAKSVFEEFLSGFENVKIIPDEIKPKQKIYIAGPMTGYKDFNHLSFFNAALELELKGYIVLNPASLPAGLSQKEYMSICLPMVTCCDAIYLLDGWEDSKGANAECTLAEKLGLTIILESE